MTRAKSIDWSQQPLGQVTDSELARRLGVDRRRVWNARTERGIPPAVPSGWPAKQKAVGQ